MCRWLAYMGNSQTLWDILFSSKHSIVIQSLTSVEGAEPTNGDGFGVGWYSDVVDTNGEPALYRTTEPAWHDKNMRDLSKHVTASTIFAHVRAASPSCGYVQQTNCHPFRYKNWLFMHNGVIRNFSLIKRELMTKHIDPELFTCIEGTTDSEIFFYLALTFGLQDDPIAAMKKTVRLIDQVAREIGNATKPIQMTVCTTNNGGVGNGNGTNGTCSGSSRKMWAFRYSSDYHSGEEGAKSRSLYYSSDFPTLTEMYPDHPLAKKFSDDARFIVSEPLGSLPGVWNPVPESSCVVVDGGSIEILPFNPLAPEDQ
jgi:predicted glutamine amidotransferase